MGWTTTHKNRDEKAIDFLPNQIFTWSGLTADQHPFVKAASQVGSVCYFALTFPAAYLAAGKGSFTDYGRDSDGSVTVGVVVLTSTSRDHYNFGWKDMDENMGPCYYTCPAKILNMLTPLVNSHCYAAQWRRGCVGAAKVRSATAKKKAALKAGSKVVLANAVRFSDGKMLQEFVAMERTKWTRKGVKFTLVYKSVEAGGLYRLTAAVLKDATITN